MTKVHEKVSGGFRSPQGALFYCRIRSYLSTCSKRGIPGHEALRLLFSGALPDFVNLAEILGELMEIVLPNDPREDAEDETPQDTTSSQAHKLNNLSSYVIFKISQRKPSLRKKYAMK